MGDEKSGTSPEDGLEGDEGLVDIDVLDNLALLAENKRFIGGATLVVALLSIVATLLMTRKYQATATIIIPEGRGGGGLLSQLGGGLGLMAQSLQSLGLSGDADFYIRILRSRTVKDRIIDRFDLQTAWGKEYRVEVYDKLDSRTEITADRGRIITIAYEGEGKRKEEGGYDVRRVADIAGAYVEELQRLTQELTLTAATQKRRFLEERLGQSKLELAEAEEALKDYKIRNNTVQIEAQLESTIKSLAELEGQLMTERVLREVALFRSSPNSPEVARIGVKITALKREIDDLRNGGVGDGEKGEPPGGTIFLPVEKAPTLGLEYARLFRNLKIQEKVFELLTQQLEMAKMNEAQDSSEIQILDPPKTPEKKVKPRRRLFVSVMTLLGFLGSIAYLYSKRYLSQAGERPEEHEKIERLKAALKKL